MQSQPRLPPPSTRHRPTRPQTTGVASVVALSRCGPLARMRRVIERPAHCSRTKRPTGHCEKDIDWA